MKWLKQLTQILPPPLTSGGSLAFPCSRLSKKTFGKVANWKQSQTNNEDCSSYSTAGNAGKTSPGVGSFIAGCFGLKAVFFVCVLVKNVILSVRGWSESMLLTACWLRTKLMLLPISTSGKIGGPPVIEGPEVRIFCLRPNIYSVKCLVIKLIVPLITSSRGSIYWQWAVLDLCDCVCVFSCHFQPIIKQIPYILCIQICDFSLSLLCSFKCWPACLFFKFEALYFEINSNW